MYLIAEARKSIPEKGDDTEKEIKKLLQECKKNQLLKAKIVLQYHVDQKLPHRRSIITDQFTISIDPGLDFIVEKRNKSYWCNENSWSFKDKEETRKQTALADEYLHCDPILI